MTQWTGPLNGLRRQDLLDLVRDLGASPGHSGYLTKYELSELIRATLKSNPHQRQDPQFNGIWQHMPESQIPEEEMERFVEENGPIEDPLIKLSQDQPGQHTHFDPDDQHKSLDELYHHEQQEEQRSTREGSSRSQSVGPPGSQGGEGNSPFPSMREAILHPHIFETLRQASPRKMVNSALAQASQTLDQLEESFEGAIEQANEGEIGPLALVPASRSLRRKASRSLSLVTKQSSHNLRVVARGSVAAVAEAQYRLSSSWILILAILFAEYGWIVYESLPWAEYSFGPYPSLVLPNVPQISLHFPALHFLLHPFFTFALVRYSFQTLLIPFVVSMIFAFPSSASTSPESSDSTHRHSRRRKLSTPSPLIFALTRLSIALLSGFILPSTSTSNLLDSQIPLHEIASHSRLALSKTFQSILTEAATASAQSGQAGLHRFVDSWRETGWKEVVGGIAGRGGGERKWKVEEIVGRERVWGVVALGMGVASVVAGVQQ